MTHIRRKVLGLLTVLLLTIGAGLALAQESQSPNAVLGPEELEQTLAPIALYPDPLLSEVLMASTYPLEVVGADRWVQSHQDLKGEALAAAVAGQGWDESIQALTQTPDVLANMSKNLDWTQKLGDAVLAQQADVMDAVQRLRSKAYESNNLQSDQHQTVIVEPTTPTQTIIIQPVSPNVVYVPYYQPTVVYGVWSYPYYPPVYYPPPPGYALGAGIAFGIGIAIAGGIWDDGFDWDNDDIDIDINDSRSINIDRTDIKNKIGEGGRDWKHNPEHRRGVQYGNDALNKKFNPQRAATNANAAKMREQFRGRDTQSTRPAANTRPSAQNRSVQNRTAGGNQPRRTSNVQQRTSDAGNGAFSNISSNRRAGMESNRGQASFGNRNRSSGRSAPSRSRGGGGRRR